jgi:methionyl-tRNA formyltransferase
MHSTVNGISMKVWQASLDTAEADEKPGEIVAVRQDGIVVACGQHALVLEIVQKSGGKKLRSAEFLLGHSLQRGDRFESRE